MDRQYHETICCCALNRIFGFRPKIAIAMMAGLGSASAVFDLDREELEEITGPYSTFRDMICRASLEEAEKELERLYRDGYSFIPYGSPDYPQELKECDDAPAGLYIRSSSDPRQVFTGRKMIAVVGTRDISGYGREWCSRLVRSLSATGTPVTIVSGLALGTDITAHETALESGIPTIAVMATGIDRIYPRQHTAAAGRIASSEGCALITDFPPGTAPLQVHFLRRNRIIAGMCSATILIESRQKGGGMMTARLAFSYSRDVFALPGRASDIRSQGCNYLIRAGVASPVTSEKDLIESLGMKYSRTSSTHPGKASSYIYKGNGDDEAVMMMSRIVMAIRENGGITVSEVASACGLSYAATAGYVTMLETDGIIYTDVAQRCYIRAK